jgi:lipopolysaccharide biosynthesis glycosyltransferase
VPDAAIAVLIQDDDADCVRTARKYDAIPITCYSDQQPGIRLKTALYAAHEVVDASEYLLIDADTLVVGDLRPLFFATRACPEDRVFICKDTTVGTRSLGEALKSVYAGGRGDSELLGIRETEAAYPLVVNTGVIAAGRAAMEAMARVLREVAESGRAWERHKPECTWREQFLYNLVLARRKCAIELDGSYNVQLLHEDVLVESGSQRPIATWRGRPARVLHFNGPSGRAKYPRLQNMFAVRFE